MALPITHPLVKTAIEFRRSINRLSLFVDQNPNDPLAPVAEQIKENLRELRRMIPAELRDQDLVDV